MVAKSLECCREAVSLQALAASLLTTVQLKRLNPLLIKGLRKPQVSFFTYLFSTFIYASKTT